MKCKRYFPLKVERTWCFTYNIGPYLLLYERLEMSIINFPKQLCFQWFTLSSMALLTACSAIRNRVQRIKTPRVARWPHQVGLNHPIKIIGKTSKPSASKVKINTVQILSLQGAPNSKSLLHQEVQAVVELSHHLQIVHQPSSSQSQAPKSSNESVLEQSQAPKLKWWVKLQVVILAAKLS